MKKYITLCAIASLSFSLQNSLFCMHETKANKKETIKEIIFEDPLDEKETKMIREREAKEALMDECMEATEHSFIYKKLRTDMKKFVEATAIDLVCAELCTEFVKKPFFMLINFFERCVIDDSFDKDI